MKYSALLLTMVTPAVFATTTLSAVSGLKYPNDPSEGSAPVFTTAWSFPDGTRDFPGYSELIPYVQRSPHQEEAGSCLYMSLTGVAEFWLNRLNEDVEHRPEGDSDLSERYLMNMAGVEESHNGMLNWKTDSVLLFNNIGKMPLNRDYRFTKGWVTKDRARDEYVYADPTSKDSEYSTRFNWINESGNLDTGRFVTLPFFQREVLFADPASDQWNVGVMPTDIVERIKMALQTKEAPVHVIYNHYGYWHAVAVVGFDDAADTKQCRFVTKFIDFMQSKADQLRADAQLIKSPQERERLLKQADKAELTSRKTAQAFKSGGGCQPRGMFYVRDSLYNDSAGPIYDYDTTRVGEEAPYSRTVVLHEYDWIRYMANHVTQISIVN